MEERKEIVLWEHQKNCVEKAQDLITREINCLALLMEVGTGKTPAAVHVLRHLFNKHKAILPTLIFGPPVILRNWKKELLAHSKIPAERVVVLSGSGATRARDLAEAQKNWSGNFIAITNYEAVQMADVFAQLLHWAPRVLVCDESHRLKNPSAVRTKRVTMLSDTARYRFILTGTLVVNDPMDMFSQFRILDGGRTFGKNFFAFRSQYFYDKNAGMPRQKYFPNWVPRKDSAEKLGRLIEGISFQAKKSECLTLPPLVHQRVEVTLSPQQRKAYDEMLKHFITFVRESACVAELAITRTLRLQQILAGFLRDEDGKDHAFEGNPRGAALRDLLEDITPAHKVIVWANFGEAYRQLGAICESMDLGHVFLTGEQSTKKKEEAVELFENDPKIRVLIGHPRAGGVGINLVAASHMIYFTRDFSRENDVQSEARNYRGGSERHDSITRWDLVAADTIDEVVLQALENKQSVAEAVLEYARSL